mmetsp:Transcript_1010/g.4456  ORF Transcript_1010/g.4456 Transcript_1010/m.4456 type:complete len:419 (+) Transcript_1010:765-2021(+)
MRPTPMNRRREKWKSWITSPRLPPGPSGQRTRRAGTFPSVPVCRRRCWTTATSTWNSTTTMTMTSTSRMRILPRTPPRRRTRTLSRPGAWSASTPPSTTTTTRCTTPRASRAATGQCPERSGWSPCRPHTSKRVSTVSPRWTSAKLRRRVPRVPTQLCRRMKTHPPQTPWSKRMPPSPRGCSRASPRCWAARNPRRISRRNLKMSNRSRFRRRVPNPRGPSRRPVTAATGSTYLRAAMTTGERRRLRRSTRRSLTMNHRRCHSRFASTTTTSLWANTQTTTRRNRRENKRRTRRFAIASPGGSGVVRANPSRCTSSSTPRAYPTTSPRTRTRTRTMVGGCRLATWSPRLKPSSGRMRIAPPPPPVSRRVLHQRCAHSTPALTRTRTWCVRVWRSFARHFPVSGRPLLNARARHPSRRR